MDIQKFCKICGSENIHIEEIGITRTNNQLCLTVGYWCEQGWHQYEIIQQEHKGVIFEDLRKFPGIGQLKSPHVAVNGKKIKLLNKENEIHNLVNGKV